MAKKTQKYQLIDSNVTDDDQWVSRSQKKRDSLALQQMGEALCELGESHLRKMPLPEILREAVLEWKRIKDHEGRRRQMQYVGRLMREEADPVPIRAALDAIADGGL